MKIASWNVNSINVRQAHVNAWLKENEPDFLFLQELKCETDKFPHDAFKESGYEIFVQGQKSNNGVAVFSKHQNCEVLFSLPGDKEDVQARFIEVKFQEMSLIGFYAPNGNPVDTIKYSYKLDWYDRLIEHIKYRLKTTDKILMTGDFNIIPEDEDCYDPIEWHGDALFKKEIRDKFYTLKHLGFEDAYRVLNKGDKAYTFWDYQNGAWQKNLGIRIDHFLTSSLLTDKIQNVMIDKNERTKERPSDHVPIMVELSV